MVRKVKKSWWTESRVERLLMWSKRYQSKRDRMQRIAKHLNTSTSAVYHKLGRMGKLSAPWTKK